MICTVADMPKKNAPSPRMVFTITKDVEAGLVRIKKKLKLRNWQHAFEELCRLGSEKLNLL